VNVAALVDERWYAIRAKAKEDSRAEANLRGWGLETFAPRVSFSAREN
jgi:hypothetical protein